MKVGGSERKKKFWRSRVSERRKRKFPMVGTHLLLNKYTLLYFKWWLCDDRVCVKPKYRVASFALKKLIIIIYFLKIKIKIDVYCNTYADYARHKSERNLHFMPRKNKNYWIYRTGIFLGTLLSSRWMYYRGNRLCRAKQYRTSRTVSFLSNRAR